MVYDFEGKAAGRSLITKTVGQSVCQIWGLWGSIWACSWPQKTEVANCRTSFPLSTLRDGLQSSVLVWANVGSILPLFTRKLKIKLMEFILKLVATPQFIGLLYLLIDRRGMLSIWIGFTCNLFSIDYHFLKICLVVSLMPFPVKYF